MNIYTYFINSKVNVKISVRNIIASLYFSVYGLN